MYRGVAVNGPLNGVTLAAGPRWDGRVKQDPSGQYVWRWGEGSSGAWVWRRGKVRDK